MELERFKADFFNNCNIRNYLCYLGKFSLKCPNYYIFIGIGIALFVFALFNTSLYVLIAATLFALTGTILYLDQLEREEPEESKKSLESDKPYY